MRGLTFNPEQLNQNSGESTARHSSDEITEAINRAVDEIGDQSDEFVAAAARRILEKTEW